MLIVASPEVLVLDQVTITQTVLVLESEWDQGWELDLRLDLAQVVGRKLEQAWVLDAVEVYAAQFHISVWDPGCLLLRVRRVVLGLELHSLLDSKADKLMHVELKMRPPRRRGTVMVHVVMVNQGLQWIWVTLTIKILSGADMVLAKIPPAQYLLVHSSPRVVLVDAFPAKAAPINCMALS